MEVALIGSVADPIEAHVDGFRCLLLDGCIDDAVGGRVMGLERGWWLLVAHFGKSCAQYGGFFRIEEEGADFGFSGGGHDFAENLGEVEDGPIGGWVGAAGAVAEEMMAACTASSFGFNEV